MLWIQTSVLALVITGAAGLWSDIPARVQSYLRSGRPQGCEVVLFVDGPLAGATNQLPAGRDGLPAHQFCALVSRSDAEGGDYTLPYQRGAFCESRHVWHYTQGWKSSRPGYLPG